MLKYILKRILSLIPVLFVVSCVIFLVVYMIPGGPATALLGMEATPDQIDALNAELGFDRPFLVQYVDWFTNVLRGDWGESYFLHPDSNKRDCRIFCTDIEPCSVCADHCSDFVDSARK